MLRSVLSRSFWTLVLTLLLAGCTALPDLAVVLDAVTFTHDERSGHRGDHILKMALLPDLPREEDIEKLSTALTNARVILKVEHPARQAYFSALEKLVSLRKLLRSVDREANEILDAACSRDFSKEISELEGMRGPRATYAFPGLAPADLIVSAGQLAYSLVIGHLQSKIKKLEEESQATYTFRQARVFNWPALRCMIAWRHLKDKSADMVVLLGRENLIDGNALRILYVRVNQAIAKTAAGTQEKPASIQLDVAVSVHAAHSEKGKHVVSQLTHQVFRPLPKVVLGKATRVCVAQESPFATSCNMQSELFPNPPPKASAFSVGIAVTETGSALGQAARAKASLASLDALIKPKFEAILKQVAAEATK